MKLLFVLAIVGSTNSADARPLANIVDLAAGTDHACAVLGTGEVACWGDIEPAPVATDPRAPALVPGVSGATAIAAADGGTCALLKTGEVWCWGIDWYIGRSHTTTGHGRQPPGAVTGLTERGRDRDGARVRWCVRTSWPGRPMERSATSTPSALRSKLRSFRNPWSPGPARRRTPGSEDGLVLRGRGAHWYVVRTSRGHARTRSTR